MPDARMPRFRSPRGNERARAGTATAAVGPWVAVRVLVFCGCLFQAPVLPASEPSATSNLTIDVAVERALRDNPELVALRARRDAMEERPVQARALPNPMFRYSGMDAAQHSAWPATNEKRFMVEQEFPWFGKRGLREEIARKDAEIMQRELEGMTRDVVWMVKEAFFDLCAVRQSMEIARRDGDVLERMARIAETLYKTGERTQQDVLKARSEITLLRQRLLDLGAQENARRAQLNTLMDRRADDPLPTAGMPRVAPEDRPVEELFAQAVLNRPEVRAEQARSERYGLEARLMAREALPDYRLGVEYRRFGDSEDMLMFTIGVELPLWESKYEAGAREAGKMKAASEAARVAAARKSSLDVQDARFRMQTARRTLALYRDELIPQAEARFAASEAGYQTGKVDFMDLLESQRFLLNARVLAAMAEGDLGMQAARLERAVGAGSPPHAPAVNPVGN